MPRKARDSAATHMLQDQITKNATGRLSVGVGPGTISVWLLKGAIVAATSPSDERQILRLVGLAEGLPPLRAIALGGVLQAGESIFGALVDEVQPSLIERLLAERFRANLAEFIGGMSRPSFEPLSMVFVDNLQLGHDAGQLVEESQALVDAAESLSPEMVLVPGATAPTTVFGMDVLDRVRRQPATVGDLMSTLPYEPLFVRAWSLDLVRSGVVNEAAQGAGAEDADDDWAEDDLTENANMPTVIVSSLNPQVSAASNAPESDGAPTVAPAADAAQDEPAQELELELDADPISESLEEPPTPGLAGLDGIDFSDDGPPPKLQSWLSAAHAVDDDELDFFEDHDYAGRGGAGEGGGKFSTDTHNLDKVSLDPEPAAPTEAIEVDEAPASRFGAPGLSETDALAKIEVINDVLRNVVAAFDENDGAGRGREVVQLLVEGSPNRYSALFSTLEIPDSGQLPPDELIANLQARPPSEQRLLLNQALSDLIERALSTVADELPEDVIDAVLEKSAGYRGRLGL